MNSMMFGEEAADATDKSKAVAPIDQSRMGLLESAVRAGNVDMFREAMTLQKEWEAYQARKLFGEALSRAKEKLPIIQKSKAVDFDTTKGRTFYRYADLAELVETVNPILTAEGIWHHFEVSNTPTHVTVRCVLEGYGHRDQGNVLTAPIDTSGNKNAIQAIGSVVTYLQRYTLMPALGLAASSDDDGQGGPKKPVRRPPSASGDAPQPQPQEETAAEEPYRPKASEGPPFPLPHSGRNPIHWAEDYIATLKAAKTPRELALWAQLNARPLEQLGRAYPDLRQKIDDTFNNLVAGEKPSTVFMSNGKETGERKPPSAADQVDSDQWRKDMEGALSGCMTIEEVEKLRGDIDNAPDGILQEHLKAVQAAYQQTVDRVVLKK